MDLNHILSQLETANEEEIDELLRQYNREVSRGSARFFYVNQNKRRC